MGVGIARGFAKAGGMMFGIMSAEEALSYGIIDEIIKKK